jgi:glycosyltransferase involved in cell wall biosynthesis
VFWFDKLYDNLNSNSSNFLKKLLLVFFNIKINKFKIFNLLRFFFKRISLRRIRWFIFNTYIFYNFFKKNKQNIDVFHFNNGGYPAKEAGLIAIIMARIFSVKHIIMTFHNVPEKRYIYRPSGYLFDFFIPKFCNKIIAASDMISQQIQSKRNFPSEKIITIRCALESVKKLNTNQITNIKLNLNISHYKRILIISGNIEEDRKGHKELFKAISKAKLVIPNILLLVVGSGSDKRMDFLEKIVKELKINNNVLFMGYRTDIFNLNSISEITLTPSVGVESIPFTIIEGARLGKPVITTTVGACSEAVINNVTGYILEPYDIESLSNKIIYLLENDNVKLKMGEQALELFNNRFLLSKAVKIHENIYLKNI